MYVDETEQPTEESKCLLTDPEWTAETSATPGERENKKMPRLPLHYLQNRLPPRLLCQHGSQVPLTSNKTADLHHIRVAILEKITASYNSDSAGGAIRDNRVHVSR